MIEEEGSAEVRDLWSAAERRVSTRLLYPEFRSALARAARTGRFRRLADDRRVAEQLWERIDSIEVTPRLAARAGDLAEQQALRAYDAVHLASVETVADSETVLVAADAALRTAAQRLGLRTALA